MLKLKSGVDLGLEQEADALLIAGRKHTLRYSDKRDVFTWEQMKNRHSHEVYVDSGVPDEALMRGVYSRPYNPELGKRPHRPNGHDPSS